MSRGRRQDACRNEVAASTKPKTEASSGIVLKEEFDAQLAGEAPPWHVVHAYLSDGQHRDWVEAHAQRSRAFAEVLAALRNDHDERRETRRRR